MNLVDDHRFDRPQRLARARGQHQVQRLRSRDENLARMPAEPRTLARTRIACADTDRWNMRGNTLALRHVCDSRKRRTQIALNIDRERFQRRDIENAATGRSRRLAQHQPVQAPQECRERFACSRRCEDQRRLAACDGGPTLALWRRHLFKDRSEPRFSNWMKQLENIIRRALHDRRLFRRSRLLR